MRALRVAQGTVGIGEHRVAEFENVGEGLAGEYPPNIAGHLLKVAVDVENRLPHPVGSALTQHLNPFPFRDHNRPHLVHRPQYDRRVADQGAQARGTLRELALQPCPVARELRDQGLVVKP